MMKKGDLVRVRGTCSISGEDLAGKTGLVAYISEPSPLFPYRIVDVAFESVLHKGIPCRMLEVVNEDENSN